MDLAHLGECYELAVCPARRFAGLPVNPLRGIGVAANLHVLAETEVANSDAVLKESLDLSEHECVALDRGRVVGVLVPHRRPDLLRLCRHGQTSQPMMQLSHRLVEASEHLVPTRPSGHGHPFSKLRVSGNLNRTV